MIDLSNDGHGVPVLRADFSDDAAWERVRTGLSAEDYSGSGYEPMLRFVDTRDLVGLDADALEAAIRKTFPSSDGESFVIVADHITMSTSEQSVLLIDLNEDDPSTAFRALPREIAAIEANLSISNMDFFEFGENADDDGVFRGFA